MFRGLIGELWRQVAEAVDNVLPPILDGVVHGVVAALVARHQVLAMDVLREAQHGSIALHLILVNSLGSRVVHLPPLFLLLLHDAQQRCLGNSGLRPSDLLARLRLRVASRLCTQPAGRRARNM